MIRMKTMSTEKTINKIILYLCAAIQGVIKYVVALGLIIAMPMYVVAQTDALEPDVGEPIYQVTDNHFINILSGTISYNIPTVSIGSGNLSLNHSITINGNDLTNYGARLYGYKDKYRGGIFRRSHTDNSCPTEFISPCWHEKGPSFYVIHVIDEQGSYNFIDNGGGDYESLEGKLVTLTEQDGHLVLTRQDGTLVHYSAKPAEKDTFNKPYGYMTKIMYPNGFEIEIHRDAKATGIGDPIRSVTTNNGLQLKYIYEQDDRSISSASAQKMAENGWQNAQSSWAEWFPKRIVALNNALETCDYLAKTCDFQHEWSEVEFTWPAGMPGIMSAASTVFTVNVAGGVVTEVFHKPYGECINNRRTGDCFTRPKIYRIKNNRGVDVNYKLGDAAIKMKMTSDPSGAFVTIPFVTSNGVITSSESSLGKHIYNYYNNYVVDTKVYGDESLSAKSMKHVGSGGYQPIDYLVTDTRELNINGVRATSTVPFKINMWDKIVYLENDWANKVTSIQSKLDGTYTQYNYDDLGRLVEIIFRPSVKQDINFLTSSQGKCSNPKTCNKVQSISNRYGVTSERKVTSYLYHQESGQISDVTYPSNEHKVGKKIHNVYQKYYARFRDEAGALITSDQPIWLLTSSATCKNSNVWTAAACKGNDRITTTYEYGSGDAGNNLFLLGQTVSTQGEDEVRTTCYKYDRFGNQIEVSEPKSGITDCNLGRAY